MAVIGAAAAAIDLPLWDLAAKRERVPLYRLLGGRGRRAVELYDSSIYIDDLRANDPPVIARVAEDSTILDLRTVHPDDDSVVAAAIATLVA